MILWLPVAALVGVAVGVGVVYGVLNWWGNKEKR